MTTGLRSRLDERPVAGHVHIDASLIRANVSMDALVSRHLDAVEAAHDDANDTEREARTSGKFKKLCRTGPGRDHGNVLQGSAAPGLQAAHGG